MGNTQSTDVSSTGQAAPSAATLAQQQQAERLRRYNGLGQASQPQPDDRAPSPSALRRTSTTGSQPVPSASPRAAAADREKAWHRTASLRVRAPSEAGGAALPRNPNARARSGSSAAAGVEGSGAPQHQAPRKPSNAAAATASGMLTADNKSLGARRKSIEIMDPDAPTSTTSSLSRRSGAPGTLSPTGFEPHLVVSPYPSPSVAMATQHAAGHPSHQGGVTAPQAISGMAAIAPTHRAIFNEPPLGGESLGAASASQSGQAPEPAKDPLGRQLTAALPSYLKIPTLIPSTYASPPGSLASSPMSNDNTRSTGSVTSGDTHAKWMDDSVLGLGPAVGPAGAAKAVLNTEDVVIGPGNASKASSPVQRHSPLGLEHADEDAHARLSTPANPDEIAAAVAEATGVDEMRPISADTPQHAEEEEEEERKGRSSDAVSPSDRAANSRTPTPTPGNSELRTLTPKGESGMAAMRPASPAASASASTVGGGERRGSIGKRGGITVVTGIESGLNTPALPPWQAQGTTRTAVRGFDVPASSPAHDQQPTPTRATANRSGSSSARPSPLTPAMGRYLPPTGPLRPVTVTWRGGGREVFVTGTFANEWRSKVPLKRTSKRDHAIVLHLEPGTHRLKFIVDDRWRVSRELPTATDGSGNLVNYIEMPILDEAEGEKQTEGEAKQKRRSAGALAGHGATMDLKEQARRAEAIRRGDLEEVFGPDKAKEEVWTQEIPAAVIKAQQAEEAYRDACEASPSNAPPPPPSLPAPPLLPRQLSTVLLNASPANPAIAQATGGAVDDLSLLPAPPNSAILHHLTASAIKNGCVAVGTTIRFKKKYVSTLYYSPC